MPDCADGRCSAGAATTSACGTDAGFPCQAQGQVTRDKPTCTSASTGQAIVDNDNSATLVDKCGVAATVDTSSCTAKCYSSSSSSNNNTASPKTSRGLSGCAGAQSKAAAATAPPGRASCGTGSHQGKNKCCTTSAQGCNGKVKSTNGYKSNDGCKPTDWILTEKSDGMSCAINCPYHASRRSKTRTKDSQAHDSPGYGSAASTDSDGPLVSASWRALLSSDG